MEEKRQQVTRATIGSALKLTPVKGTKPSEMAQMKRCAKCQRKGAESRSIQHLDHTLAPLFERVRQPYTLHTSEDAGIKHFRRHR